MTIKNVERRNNSMEKRFFVVFITFLLLISPIVYAEKGPGVQIYKEIHESVGMIVVEFTLEFMGETEKSGIRGTGFFFDKDKPYILTNNHVAGIPDTLSVPTFFGVIEIKISDKKFFFIDHEGNIYPCHPLATCKKLDMAILKVDEISEWKALKLGNPANLEVGEKVWAIGSPLGLHNTFTEGIVSALERYLPGFNPEMEFIGWIQTDCHINPGNSGGPLVNSDSEVVGINTLSANGGSVSGIYFALPIDLFKFPWFWNIIDKEEFPELK